MHKQQGGGSHMEKFGLVDCLMPNSSNQRSDQGERRNGERSKRRSKRLGGSWDALIADYTKDMIFVMPGQNDVLKGVIAFRKALENLGAALPPGFEITSIRNIGETGEVVSIVEWKSTKIPEGSQVAILFRLTDGKVYEERWFVDTEQWKAAF